MASFQSVEKNITAIEFAFHADSVRAAIGCPSLLWRRLTDGKFIAYSGAIFAVSAAAALLIFPSLVDGIAPAWRIAGIIVLFVGLMLTKVVPDHFNVLTVLLTAGAATSLPLDVVFSGFQSSAAWVVFGGFIIGAAIKQTGIGDRISRAILQRTGRSYIAVIYGIFASGMILAFVLPTATGRIFTLVAICVAIADRLGFAPGSPARSGILIAAVISAVMPGYAVLPSTIPNMVMLSTAQNLYGVGFSYAEYFVAVFPVLTLFTLVFAPLLINRMFSAPVVNGKLNPNVDEGNGRTRSMGIILSIALVLWASDFLHGISPVWVTLAAAVACLAPRFGPIREEPLDRCVHISPWMVIAALVSIATMIDHSGLGRILGRELVEFLELSPGNDLLNFTKIVGISTTTGVFMTSMVSPAVISSFAQELANSAGWSIEATLLSQIPSWFFIMLPHQVPVILIGLTMGQVPLRPAIRFMLVFAASGFAIATPLYFVWLCVLGYFG